MLINVTRFSRWTKEREVSIPPFNVVKIFPPLVWALSLASMLSVFVFMIGAKVVGDKIGTETQSEYLVLFPFR